MKLLSKKLLTSKDSSRVHSYCWEIIDSLYEVSDNSDASDWNTTLHSLAIEGVGTVVKTNFSQWYAIQRDQRDHTNILLVKTTVKSPFRNWITGCFQSILILKKRFGSDIVCSDEIKKIGCKVNSINTFVEALLPEDCLSYFKIGKDLLMRQLEEFRLTCSRISYHLVKGNEPKLK